MVMISSNTNHLTVTSDSQTFEAEEQEAYAHPESRAQLIEISKMVESRQDSRETKRLNIEAQAQKKKDTNPTPPGGACATAVCFFL